MKCSLHKHEDLSFDRQQPCENPAQYCNPALERWRQKNPKAWWTTRLAESANSMED